MTDQLAIAFQITIIGMGLVFAAILLLWGLMAVLVRFTSERGTAGRPESETERYELKQRAAAAAVAFALAEEDRILTGEEVHEFPLPPTAIVSPWQGVMRSKMLNKRGNTR
jgi:Na+-transporting methylmalonyl-CoA/oxaloacetate decarboxylase gamma subunit